MAALAGEPFLVLGDEEAVAGRGYALACEVVAGRGLRVGDGGGGNGCEVVFLVEEPRGEVADNLVVVLIGGLEAEAMASGGEVQDVDGHRGSLEGCGVGGAVDDGHGGVVVGIADVAAGRVLGDLLLVAIEADERGRGVLAYEIFARAGMGGAGVIADTNLVSL